MSQILNEFLKIYTMDNVLLTTIVFVVAFIIYELPDILKLFKSEDAEYEEEYEEPPGKILNGILFVIGLLITVFVYFGGKLPYLVSFIKNYSYSVPTLIALVSISIIAIFGFLKKVATLIEKDAPVGKLLKHSFFELGKTVFYISLAILVIPALLFLLFGG